MPKEKQKNCGIVTLYDDNYGTCLQAYALYAKIKELGYMPTIIRYVRSEKTANTKKGTIGKISKVLETSPRNLVNYILSYRMICDRKAGFEKFRQQFLNFSKAVSYRYAIDDGICKVFDGYICGSDMIWSEEFVKDWDYFFLQFAPEQKRIAYAPSFGNNVISLENQELCGRMLSGIRHLSCREETGAAMVKQQFGADARQVLDPTLLMNKEEWNQILEKKERAIQEKYTLTYVFGGLSGARERIVSQIKEMKMGMYKVIPMNRNQNKKDACKGILGPEEFLHLYKDAEFIVTDTFHGMIFALIYEKPFIVLEREDGGHWAKYSDRMTSTLKMLGLEERYLSSRSTIPNRFKELDYSGIRQTIQQKRKESMEYLKYALAEVME